MMAVAFFLVAFADLNTLGPPANIRRSYLAKIPCSPRCPRPCSRWTCVRTSLLFRMRSRSTSSSSRTLPIERSTARCPVLMDAVPVLEMRLRLSLLPMRRGAKMPWFCWERHPRITKRVHALHAFQLRPRRSTHRFACRSREGPASSRTPPVHSAMPAMSPRKGLVWNIIAVTTVVVHPAVAKMVTQTEKV